MYPSKEIKERPKKKYTKRKRVRVSRSAFPSTFTVFNMLCGYVSIVMANNENYHIAAWFILFAAVFDLIDGLVARLTKSSSKFGTELDSLSDLVSFGAAPAFLIYSFGLSAYGSTGIGISSLIMIACGLRLARFNINVDTNKKSVFHGLPAPAQAITIATLVLSISGDYPFMYVSYKNELLVILSLSLSALMVSKLKYNAIPKPTISEFRKKPTTFSLFLLSGFLIVAFQIPAFFLIMIGYISLGILSALYRVFKPKQPVKRINATTDTNP